MRCIPCGRLAAEGYEQQQRHGTIQHRINSSAFECTPTPNDLPLSDSLKALLSAERSYRSRILAVQYTKPELNSTQYRSDWHNDRTRD